MYAWPMLLCPLFRFDREPPLTKPLVCTRPWCPCVLVLAAFIPSGAFQAQTCRARSNVVTMAKKSVGSLGEADLKGKRVFVRVDLNVPLDGKKITDDTRIRASVPTIKYLQEKGAKVGHSLLDVQGRHTSWVSGASCRCVPLAEGLTASFCASCSGLLGAPHLPPGPPQGQGRQVLPGPRVRPPDRAPRRQGDLRERLHR